MWKRKTKASGEALKNVSVPLRGLIMWKLQILLLYAAI